MSACNGGDPDLISGLSRSPGEGYGSPVHFSCLDNPHGQKSQACSSPWVRKELDTTKHHLLNGREFEQALGVGDEQGSLSMLQSMGSQRV